MMRALFRLNGSARIDPPVRQWFDEEPRMLRAIAFRWFESLRNCGDEVLEVLHDGHPTACVDGVAFAYVDSFKSHVNVGLFHGGELPDPQGLLEGTGRFMRHVKLRPEKNVDEDALIQLIKSAYLDVKARIAAQPGDR